MSEQLTINDNLILLCGKSSTGKSVSLMNIENPTGVMYLNCEAGKKLPFKSKFHEYVITDPMQIFQAFIAAESRPEIHTIAIDSLTYLMEMYETKYVLTSSNTMKAWGDYQQFFKVMMQEHVAKSSKNVIFIAHTKDQLNETEMVVETKVPVKGALQNTGIESYFSCILTVKKMKLSDLEQYKNPLLTITPQDEAVGYKHVFQTQPTKTTTGERIRSPIGMWKFEETFINNDAQLVLNRLREYYN